MISEEKALDIKKLVGMGWKSSDIGKFYKISESSAERYMRVAKDKVKPEVPRILLLDIETAPSEFYGFEIGYGLTIHHYQIKEGFKLAGGFVSNDEYKVKNEIIKT